MAPAVRLGQHPQPCSILLRSKAAALLTRRSARAKKIYVEEPAEESDIILAAQLSRTRPHSADSALACLAPDVGKEHFEERINFLCKVLYFYYCSMRREVPAFSNLSSLHGVWSNPADTALPVFDDFPEIESIEGLRCGWIGVEDLL
jgi:hypothetical protein